MGWTQFCADHPSDCASKEATARYIVMTAKMWAELGHVNRFVNNIVKPLADIVHWGILERWSYPTDGYGDCEDYVLLKRKMLIDTGWPQESLLITVVHDKSGEGHAVLTVTTEKGDFVLDNESSSILPWRDTGYRYIKRQSQTNPNLWVSIGTPGTMTATASAH
jgi:predicted transglutaminase-like cysteine proteinase